MREATNLKFGIMYSLFEWFNPVYAIDKASGYRTSFFPATKTLPELKDLVSGPRLIRTDHIVPYCLVIPDTGPCNGLFSKRRWKDTTQTSSGLPVTGKLLKLIGIPPLS